MILMIKNTGKTKKQDVKLIEIQNQEDIQQEKV